MTPSTGFAHISLAVAVLVTWNQRNKPPLNVAEIATCVRKARKHGQKDLPLIVPEASQHAELLRAELGYTNLALPVHVLPDCISRLITEGAKAISCSVDLIFGPLLGCIGAVIGRSRLIEIKRGWQEAPAIWILQVVDSGAAKSPSQSLVTDILLDTEIDGFDWVDDSTTEALGRVISASRRGVLMIKDEFSGFIRGLNQYKNGKGSDLEFFLSVYNGKRVRIDRRADGTTELRNPLLAMVGSIQSHVFDKLFTQDMIDCGFASRFLVLKPPRVRRKYTEDVISACTMTAIRELFEKLSRLPFEPDSPKIIRFSSVGKAAWCEWIRSHQEETEAVQNIPGLVEFWIKLEGYAARLCLIVHTVRQILEETNSAEVEAETMGIVVELINYFKAHAFSVYGKQPVAEPASDSDSVPDTQRRIVGWMQKRGDPGVQPRDVVEAHITSKSEEARHHLESMKEQGIVVSRVPEGMRSSRYYLRSASQQAATQSPDRPEGEIGGPDE